MNIANEFNIRLPITVDGVEVHPSDTRVKVSRTTEIQKGFGGATEIVESNNETIITMTFLHGESRKMQEIIKKNLTVSLNVL